MRGVVICSRADIDAQVFNLFELSLPQNEYSPERLAKVIGDMKPATLRFISILKKSAKHIRESITMYNYQKSVESCFPAAGPTGRVDKLIRNVLMNIPFTPAASCDKFLKKIAQCSGRVAAKWNNCFGVNMRWFCMTSCNQKYICQLAETVDTLAKTATAQFDELQTTLKNIYEVTLPERDEASWFEATMDLTQPIEWPA